MLCTESHLVYEARRPGSVSEDAEYKVLGLAAPEGRQPRICFPVRHGELSKENACGAGSPLTGQPSKPAWS